MEAHKSCVFFCLQDAEGVHRWFVVGGYTGEPINRVISSSVLWDACTKLLTDEQRLGVGLQLLTVALLPVEEHAAAAALLMASQVEGR